DDLFVRPRLTKRLSFRERLPADDLQRAHFGTSTGASHGSKQAGKGNDYETLDPDAKHGRHLADLGGGRSLAFLPRNGCSSMGGRKAYRKDVNMLCKHSQAVVRPSYLQF